MDLSPGATPGVHELRVRHQHHGSSGRSLAQGYDLIHALYQITPARSSRVYTAFFRHRSEVITTDVNRVKGGAGWHHGMGVSVTIKQIMRLRDMFSDFPHATRVRKL